MTYYHVCQHVYGYTEKAAVCYAMQQHVPHPTFHHACPHIAIYSTYQLYQLQCLKFHDCLSLDTQGIQFKAVNNFIALKKNLITHKSQKIGFGTQASSCVYKVPQYTYVYKLLGLQRPVTTILLTIEFLLKRFLALVRAADETDINKSYVHYCHHANTQKNSHIFSYASSYHLLPKFNLFVMCAQYEKSCGINWLT